MTSVSVLLPPASREAVLIKVCIVPNPTKESGGSQKASERKREREGEREREREGRKRGRERAGRESERGGREKLID